MEWHDVCSILCALVFRWTGSHQSENWWQFTLLRLFQRTIEIFFERSLFCLEYVFFEFVWIFLRFFPFFFFFPIFVFEFLFFCFLHSWISYYYKIIITSSTAQGGGGSFKNRKPIGEVGCCESGMAERSHWWSERWLISLTISLSFSGYLPTYLSTYLSLSLFYLITYLSIYLSLSLPFICLAVYLSICGAVSLSVM